MTTLPSDGMRNTFTAAKRWWRAIFVVQIALLVLSATGILLAHPAVSVALGAIALLGTVALYWLKQKAGSAYATAESLRRAGMLTDGLGVAMEPGDIARLHVIAATDASPDPVPIGRYYNSRLPPGPRRLACAVWESAHFTNEQAKDIASRTGSLAAIGAILVFVFLYVIVAAGPDLAEQDWLARNSARIAAAAGTLLTFFGLGTLGELWQGYRTFAEVASRVCNRAEALTRDPETTLPRVVFLLEEYNCAAASAAPIPSFVWRRHQKPLTDSWAKSGALVE